MAYALAGVAVAGAAVGMFDFFGPKGQSLTITNNITSEMLVNATTSSATDCFQTLDADQTISVNAQLPPRLQPKLDEACVYCLNALTKIRDAREKLEAEVDPSVRQVANPDLNSVMITGGSTVKGTETPTLGPCQAICKDVVLFNVAQSITMTAKGNCSVTNNLRSDITQSLNAQIASKIKNQQDFFGQLSTAFSSNQQTITNSLSDTLSANITTSFVQELNQAMLASQKFTVTGNSVLATKVQQLFTGEMAGQLLVNNTVTDQLRQSATYSISQSILNKNDTVGDFAKNFLATIETITSLMDDLATQVIVIVAAILVAIVLVMGSLFIFNKNFQSWATVKATEKFQETFSKKPTDNPVASAKKPADYTPSAPPDSPSRR